MANGNAVSRRTFIKAVGATAGAVTVVSRVAMAQTAPGGPAAPPSTITSPPRDFGQNGAPTTYFTDPDVLTVDPLFNGLRQPNAAIIRLWSGALWFPGGCSSVRGGSCCPIEAG